MDNIQHMSQDVLHLGVLTFRVPSGVNFDPRDFVFAAILSIFKIF